MVCGNCKKEVSRIRIRYDKLLGAIENCESCGTVGHSYIPDVFWPGHSHYNENITDKMGKPILLESRMHKADVMRQQNMSECGDAVHGTKQGAYKYAVR